MADIKLTVKWLAIVWWSRMSQIIVDCLSSYEKWLKQCKMIEANRFHWLEVAVSQPIDPSQFELTVCNSMYRSEISLGNEESSFFQTQQILFVTEWLEIHFRIGFFGAHCRWPWHLLAFENPVVQPSFKWIQKLKTAKQKTRTKFRRKCIRWFTLMKYEYTNAITKSKVY